MRQGPHHIGTAGASDGDALVYDAASDEYVPASVSGGGSLTVQDENGNVATGVTQLDFQGAGVAAASGTGEVVVTISGGGGGTSFEGHVGQVLCPSYFVAPGNTSLPTAQGRAFPMTLPGPMLLRGLVLEVATGASGTIQWGLFDPQTSATSATKVAGGSGVASSSGAILIAAASAPVAAPAGGYVLIVAFPSSNSPTLVTRTATAAPPWNRVWTSYTWDDTPDLTSGSWAASTVVPMCYLKGDLNAAGAAWW